jgi:hypothetical protein
MSVTMFIDDLEVGRAETLEIDEARQHVRLEGLDGTANMFFSAAVGPGEREAPLSGRIAIRDERGRTTLTVLGAHVFEYSSGNHDVVLAATELRR